MHARGVAYRDLKVERAGPFFAISKISQKAYDPRGVGKDDAGSNSEMSEEARGLL